MRLRAKTTRFKKEDNHVRFNGSLVVKHRSTYYNRGISTRFSAYYLGAIGVSILGIINAVIRFALILTLPLYLNFGVIYFCYQCTDVMANFGHHSGFRY